MTWAFWLSMIQANRRLAFTASRISGHNRRTSTSPTDPEEAGTPAGAAAADAEAAGADAAAAAGTPAAGAEPAEMEGVLG